MKKLLLLFILFAMLGEKGFAQFSATLAGYPLVTTGWNVGGSATVVDSTIRLTPATGTQSGYVYYNTPVNLTSCGQFTVDFDFKIVVSAASQVADGIAFWYISNPPSAFVPGGGIGLPSNPNGLVMIMDTYDNTAPVNVPLETLMGYDGTVAGYTEGSTTGLLAPVVGSQPFITDGTWHHCKIVYNMGNVTVFFNYSATPSLSGTYPLTIAGYFGFSSSTGAAFSTQSVKSIYITAAGTAVPPTVTSPVTYCQNDVATPLTATATPGNVLKWFTTDTGTVVSLPGAPTPNTSVTGTTWYFVRQTSSSGGCISNPDSVEVIVSPHPTAPVISGTNAYCQGAAFSPFTVTGTTGSVMWYTAATGGPGSLTPITVNTGVPGYTSVWVSQVVAGCEGPRDSIGVRVTTTPAVPTISGTTSYCQYIGPYTPVTVNLTPTGSQLWYTAATGGTGVATEPPVNINIAGVNSFYLSQVDSGCESNRLPVTINVNPKPTPPAYTQPVYCQFNTAAPLNATGTNVMWYGPGNTAGYTTAPTPQTTVPGTDSFYVTQTSVFGCKSDSGLLMVKVTPQPMPPLTEPVSYCRMAPAVALTATGSNLKWYLATTGGTALTTAPVPSTSYVGASTWYVTQTVDGCESNMASITVNTVYTPNFSIVNVRGFVCQFDTVNLAYSSGDNVPVNYHWTMPNGATIIEPSNDHVPSIMVRFDSTNQLIVVHLTATTLDGMCSHDTTLQINVVEIPSAQAYSKHNICLGDTAALALTYRSATADNYVWKVDNTALASATAVDVVSRNADSGGPYLISWNDSGKHIIMLTTLTREGCKSAPSYDTVDVHPIPDATFKIKTKNNNLCLEDSVLFVANATDYGYSYTWAPEHSFDNVNKGTTWGKVEEAKSMISLSVKDAFGCVATYTQEIDPSSCCKIYLPNAFTPGNATTNNRFRPVFAGFHRFQYFRIANRWGQTIFETTNNVPEWDGTYNGIPQDVGTYYYIIKYDCGGNVIEQKGDVTLVR